MPITTPGEWISSEAQTERWVRGESVHRQFKLEIVDEVGHVVRTEDMDECVPDFSCCRPNLRVDRETREAFAAASERERHKFLGTFLRAMLTAVHLEEKVTIVVGPT